MKIRNFVLVCTCIMGLIQPVWGQKANQTATPGILGYLDPKTGAFRPLVQNPVETEETAAAAAASLTGKFVFNFTITIASTNLGSNTIVCQSEASVADSGSFITLTESASVKATVTGTTARCTVTIPYSWALKSASTDTVSLSISVDAVGPAATSGQPTRLSTQTLPSIKVPLTGATTTETIASTI